MKKIVLFVIITFICQVGVSINQPDSTPYNNVLILLAKLKFKQAEKEATQENNEVTKKLLLLLIKIIKDDRQTKLSILDRDYNKLKVQDYYFHKLYNYLYLSQYSKINR